MKTIYKKILLKLSGESLMGHQGYGIDPERLGSYARQIAELADAGVQVAIVIGGGNIFRGLSGASKGFDRVKGDQMGMLATVINSLALSSALESLGKQAKVLTSIVMSPIGEGYSTAKALDMLAEGKIVIIAGGTGNPFFTTDTAAALRALEIDADIMFKATNVDGVYDKDPHKFEDAKKYDTLSFDEILSHDLKVMDGTAASLCRDNSIPILVFNLDDPQNIVKAIEGENVGTVVK